MIAYDEKEKNNYQYIVLEIDEQKTGIARDQILDILRAENILARRYFYPGCHRMEPYRSLFPHANLFLPQTEELSAKVLALPNGMSVNSEVIVNICKIIRFSIKHSKEIKQQLFHQQTENVDEPTNNERKI